MTANVVLAQRDAWLPDEASVTDVAAQLARHIMAANANGGAAAARLRIHLKGDLGAGKTTFARALLRACGITGRIKSPSYALLEGYNVSNLYFYHLDFYRFSNPQEWIDAGFRDILQEDAVVLVEWPEQAGALLPPPDIEIRLAYASSGRQARLIAYSKKGQLWLTTLTLPPAASPTGDTRGASF